MATADPRLTVNAVAVFDGWHQPRTSHHSHTGVIDLMFVLKESLAIGSQRERFAEAARRDIMGDGLTVEEGGANAD